MSNKDDVLSRSFIFLLVFTFWNASFFILFSHPTSVTEYSQARCLPKEIACNSDLLRLMTDCRNAPSEQYNVSNILLEGFCVIFFLGDILSRRAQRSLLCRGWSLRSSSSSRQRNKFSAYRDFGDCKQFTQLFCVDFVNINRSYSN